MKRKPPRRCAYRHGQAATHACVSHSSPLLLCGRHADDHRRRGDVVATLAEIHAAYHRMHRGRRLRRS